MSKRNYFIKVTNVTQEEADRIEDLVFDHILNNDIEIHISEDRRKNEQA